MELLAISNHKSQNVKDAKISNNRFIESNTSSVKLMELKENHIIPVFAKDNEPTICHADFIEATSSVANYHFGDGTSSIPEIRVSHPIMGRIPEARNKPAKELQDFEKTLYYERMAFFIEIPTISKVIDGNLLYLTVGGVKAYNQDNLYSTKGSYEHFKIFIGFKNTVCTNLCIWSDGYVDTLKVRSLRELVEKIHVLIYKFDSKKQLADLERFSDLNITESQFAQLLGRARMYQHLPKAISQKLPTLQFNDTQLSSIAEQYYKDESFSRNDDGTINLWKLYNLFTGANKSSYIDKFLDRGVNAHEFTSGIAASLEDGQKSWFLS